jgi:hypothetical protein
MSISISPMSAVSSLCRLRVARGLLGATFALGALLVPHVSRAQWISESYRAPAGWSAIWVPLDLTHTSIADALSGHSEIEEIWRWNPASGPQFVSGPTSPVQPNAAWSVWKRGLPAQSTLFAITGNAAYLVKVRDGAAPVTFTLKGRPIRPEYPWTTTGVNLVGFPVSSPAPVFSEFLGLAGFTNEPTILGYVGGALSNTAPKNPDTLNTATATVTRGNAYWVQATQYTDYYGPVAVELSERSGFNFGRNRVTVAVRLKNVTAGARARDVDVSLAPVASEAPPAIIAGTASMGSGATAGRVASIVPDLNTGMVYATPPIVTIDAPAAGTTATATAVLDAAGRITRFTVTNAGAGYGAVTPVVRVTPQIAGAVPLKVRGAFDPVTSEFAHSDLTTAHTVTLKPGEEKEIVLVANRSAMTAASGTLYASLVRISDGTGHTSIDIPVTAVSSDFTGLWSGIASITQVDQIIGETPIEATIGKAVATITNGAVSGVEVTSTSAFYSSVPAVTFSGGGGSGAEAVAVLTKGLLTGVTVTKPGSGYTEAPLIAIAGGEVDPRRTQSPFPLRLIVHRAANGDTRLLQQVYLGTDGNTTTLATAENLFPSSLKPSARTSTSHFPADLVRLGVGALGSSGTVTFEVLLDYDSDSNPFVHRFHPDHDNLDSRFEGKLPAGRESFTVRRAITLEFKPTLPGIHDPAWGVSMLGGTYTEVVTGLRSMPVSTSGTFILYRLDDTSTLLTP